MNWLIKNTILFLLIFILPSEISRCQQISITQSATDKKGNMIEIEYTITENNYKLKNFYNVFLDVKDQKGEKLDAHSLLGDYNVIKNCFGPKHIMWDIAKDSIFLNENVTVQVKAEVLPRLFSKPVELGLSGICPGWGLSRIHKGKPYWLLGLTGYGCVTASVILNRQASQNYRSYLDTEMKQESERLFDRAIRQDRLSETLAWAAAGIWAVNLLWVAVTPNHPKPSVDFQKWSLAPAVSIYKHPMIALQYKF